MFVTPETSRLISDQEMLLLAVRTANLPGGLYTVKEVEHLVFWALAAMRGYRCADEFEGTRETWTPYSCDFGRAEWDALVVRLDHWTPSELQRLRSMRDLAQHGWVRLSEWTTRDDYCH